MQAVSYLSDRLAAPPRIGLILGTGLGTLGDKIQRATMINYGEIPYFPESTVEFHAGKLISGTLAGQAVLAMQGRFHYYEGYTMQEITLPIRVMHQLGIRTLIISNAAGGIREELSPGTLALINDHINLMGDNPLIGTFDPFLGSRFPDMSEPYSVKLRHLAHKAAEDLGIKLVDSIYAAVSGPSFETPAEIRMLRAFGIDSIGMSVVPEVLVARQLAMDVLGLSAITDQSLPEEMQPISHEQVSRVAKEITPTFNALVEEIIKRI
ncbi:purine-nucleoside phosphorylase [candidate division KSB1 bacterium]|nr:purine-nucleoside phosphorylase [candidate division KSB1 bacterium]RQW11428.1 MAG: purine-nucleoside phosphorylase [candidate division KSB1 bacterium]